MRSLLVSFALFVSPMPAFADGVPTSLFGIEVGKVYDLGQNNIGDLPVKNFRGYRKFLGEGVTYFFEPIGKNSEFIYIEKQNSASEEFFETSFRLYLLPVVASDVSDLESFYAGSLLEVDLVEWNAEKDTEEDAYFWAFQMCERFEADIGIEPIVLDDFKKSYDCIFTGEKTELKVRGAKAISITLANLPAVSLDKGERLRNLRLKLELKEIKPY